MTMIWLTEPDTGTKVAINTEQVVAVFTGKEEPVLGKTIIGLINGNVVVEEDDLSVVTMINGD